MRTLPLLALVAVAILGGVGWLLLQPSESSSTATTVSLAPDQDVPRALQPTSAEGGQAELASLEERRKESSREVVPTAQPEQRTQVASARPEPEPIEDPYVRGRVVDAYGSPLEDAQIVVFAIPPQIRDLRNQGMMGMQDMSRMGRKKKSDSADDGKFQVEAPSLDQELEIDVQLKGHVKVTLAVGRPSSFPLELGDVTLKRGCVIAGRVVDEGNQPLKGAQVNLRRENEDDDDPMGLKRIGFDLGPKGPRTDKNGAFEFAYEPAGDFTLEVTHKRRPDVKLRGSAQLGDTLDLVVEMPAGGIIAGRVDDLPDDLRGVIVQARRIVDPGDIAKDEDEEDEGMLGVVFEEMGMSTGEHWAKVRKGKFELTGLEPSGRYLVWAAAPHRQMIMREACSEELPAYVGDDDLVITYAAGSKLSFQVLDARSGKPIQKMDVFSKLGGGNLPSRRDEIENDEGKVVLSNLRPEDGGSKLQLMVRAVGYQSHRSEFRVMPGSDQSAPSVYLHSAPVAKILVLDNVGEPVEGASVWISPEDTSFQRLSLAGRSFGNMSTIDIDDEDDQSPRSGLTDAQGRVELNSIPGLDAALTVRAPGHALYREVLTLPISGDVERQVQLGMGGRLLISVVDRDGYASPKAMVEHRTVEETGMRGNHTSDDLGQLTLDNLTPGEHQFRVLPPGSQIMGGPPRGRRGERGERAGAEWTNVTVEEGQVEELVLAEPVFSQVSGRITEAGKPLSGAKLMLIPRDDDEEESQVVVEGMERWMAVANDDSDERGVYQMVDVPVGTYTLQVAHADRVMSTRVPLDLEEGDTEFDLDLDVTAASGRLVDGQGRPIEGAEVQAVPEEEAGRPRVGLRFLFGGDERKSATTDSDGRFELKGLNAEESIVVRGQAEWHSPATSEPFTLEQGEWKEGIELTLEAAGSLTVEVDGGRMFQNIRLSRETPVEPSSVGSGEEEALPGTLNESNTRIAIVRRKKAVFEDLEPGVWKITAGGEDHGSVTIEAGQATTHRIVLEEE